MPGPIDSDTSQQENSIKITTRSLQRMHERFRTSTVVKRSRKEVRLVRHDSRPRFLCRVACGTSFPATRLPRNLLALTSMNERAVTACLRHRTPPNNVPRYLNSHWPAPTFGPALCRARPVTPPRHSQLQHSPPPQPSAYVP
jgi:hypothetical protein